MAASGPLCSVAFPCLGFVNIEGQDEHRDRINKLFRMLMRISDGSPKSRRIENSRNRLSEIPPQRDDRDRNLNDAGTFRNTRRQSTSMRQSLRRATDRTGSRSKIHSELEFKTLHYILSQDPSQIMNSWRALLVGGNPSQCARSCVLLS